MSEIYLRHNNQLGESKFESYSAFQFMCPGCDDVHVYYVGDLWNGKKGWEFNGNYERPTFTPSLLNTGTKRCHLFLTDGCIHYCEDCEHSLAGQAVEMMDLPIGWNEER